MRVFAEHLVMLAVSSTQIVFLTYIPYVVVTSPMDAEEFCCRMHVSVL